MFPVTPAEAVEILRRGPAGVKEWNALLNTGGGTIIPPRNFFANVDLSGFKLQGVHFIGLDFLVSTLVNTDLRGSVLMGTGFESSCLAKSKLDGANASGCRFVMTDLRHASLRGVNLTGAQFVPSTAAGCDLTGAILAGTFIMCRFEANAATQVIGVDQVIHKAPSFMPVQVMLDSMVALPDSFLQGCGLIQAEIDYFRSMPGMPRRASAFISYSSEDSAFADRLYRDLARHVRCWKWDEDAKTGRPLWQAIDSAIRRNDKLILIASKHSLNSPAVIREINRALNREDERRRKIADGDTSVDPDVLFPVAIDRYIFDEWDHHRKADVLDKKVADATGWEKSDTDYQRVLNRLIRDLEPDVGMTRNGV